MCCWQSRWPERRRTGTEHGQRGGSEGHRGGGKEPFFPGKLGKGVGEWAKKGILRGKDGKQGSLHLHGSAR